LPKGRKFAQSCHPAEKVVTPLMSGKTSKSKPARFRGEAGINWLISRQTHRNKKMWLRFFPAKNKKSRKSNEEKGSRAKTFFFSVAGPRSNAEVQNVEKLLKMSKKNRKCLKK
jgi:hypothetical protein